MLCPDRQNFKGQLSFGITVDTLGKNDSEIAKYIERHSGLPIEKSWFSNKPSVCAKILITIAKDVQLTCEEVKICVASAIKDNAFGLIMVEEN